MNKPDDYAKARQVYIGFCRGKPCTYMVDLEHHQTIKKAVSSDSMIKLV